MTILRNNISKVFFLSVFSLILFLPFFNKAISSDSIFYIYSARQILKEPLNPFNFQINCADKNYLGWDIANNPPLMSYFLAGVIRIFGEKEKIFHLIFFGFTLLSIIGMYFLADELKINPFFSALLLIASPAFFVNATDIMLDIPLLACSLWGIYFIIRSPRLVAPDFSRGGGSPDKRIGINSANKKFIGWILLGLAVLIKFIAIINLPVIFIWLLLNKKLKENLIFFTIPILFLIAWSVHNKLIYGEIQIFAKSTQVGLSFGLIKEIPLLTYIGGSFIFPLSVLWMGFELKKKLIWCFVVIFALINFLFTMLNYSVIQNLLFGILISSAFLLIYLFIEHLKKYRFQKEVIFLACWFFLHFFFFMCVSAIIAVRYLLPLVPAVILLFVKIAEKVPNQKVFLTFTAITGIILSVFVSHSDYVLANSYRETANYVKMNYPGRIFFRGDLSFRGFQYYMEKNGFACIDVYDKNDLSGSYIIKSNFSIAKELAPAIKRNMKFVEEKCITTKNPLRTMSPFAQAGFHLNLYGLLPYSFSKMPLEKFVIYKVK